MRLIDADEVITVISNHHFDEDKNNFDLLIHNLCKEVKKIPTAYNPEKVVEELEENSSNYKKSYKVNGKYTHKTIKAISRIKAIGIVRKGGIG